MSRSDTRRIDRVQELAGRGVEQAYTQADFSRFPPSRLEQMNPGLRVNPVTAQSAFLGNIANPLAGRFQLQRMPGAQYANYERMAPNIGGPLTAPQVPLGFVPPGTQPETIRVYPDGSPVPDVVEEEDDSPSSDSNELLERINAFQLSQGKEPYGSINEFYADMRGQIGSEGGFNPFGGRFAEGGIASLDPQGMFLGGLMSAIGQGAAAAGGALAKGASALGGAAARGLGGLKDIALKGMENYNKNMRVGGIGALGGVPNKPIEEMTREELIAYIRKISGSEGPERLGMAEGGDVDFPRMNGPISGPGTETSDDIPAMLSDGEFVVNAKAVRGIGRLKGAGKTKAEQRKEGARMMYALQRAGEQAMRKA